jgi:hypothetical protein
MAPIPSLWWPDELKAEDARRVAAGINEILKALGRRPEDIDGWWNSTPFSELGNRTPTQAWLAGDYEAVRDLIESLQARSLAGAHRAMADPAMKMALRKQLAKLG